MWSNDVNVLKKYGGKNVLSTQLLPPRGVRVIEKTVKGKLNSYIQWGFPLMQDIDARTSGIHPSLTGGKLPENKSYSDINPGPYISSGYRLVIEYTQGDKAGEAITEDFGCPFVSYTWLMCQLKRYSASYDVDTYHSSVFSFGVEGSLQGAKITVYSRTSKDLISSPAELGVVGEHEQFVDELIYDEA